MFIIGCKDLTSKQLTCLNVVWSPVTVRLLLQESRVYQAGAVLLYKNVVATRNCFWCNHAQILELCINMDSPTEFPTYNCNPVLLYDVESSL